MEKKSLAEIEQVMRQSDENNLTQKENIVSSYITNNGEAILFKDGSILEYADEYQTATITTNPNKEIELKLDKNENEFLLIIIDQKNSKKISEEKLGAEIRSVSIDEKGNAICKEKDSDLILKERKLEKEELKDYLKEVGLDLKNIKRTVSFKNCELNNQSILDFLKEKVNDFIPNKKEKKTVKNKI